MGPSGGGTEAVTELLVLVEQDVWDDFRPAVEAIGSRWTSPSGRDYALRLEGRRLEVSLTDPEPLPSGDDIDADLFALACGLYDDVGGEWSSDALRQTSTVWGWSPDVAT